MFGMMPTPAIARMTHPDIPRPRTWVNRSFNIIPALVPPILRMMPAPAIARMTHPDIPRPWHRVGRLDINGPRHGWLGQNRFGHAYN